MEDRRNLQDLLVKEYYDFTKDPNSIIKHDTFEGTLLEYAIRNFSLKSIKFILEKGAICYHYKYFEHKSMFGYIFNKYTISTNKCDKSILKTIMIMLINNGIDVQTEDLIDHDLLNHYNMRIKNVQKILNIFIEPIRNLIIEYIWRKKE